MPISPAYSWSETSTIVTVTAQTKNGKLSSDGLFSSPFYVSFNAPPYFLELDLFAAIDSTRSVATARQGTIVLKLFKAEEKQWGQLLADLPRADRLKRREASRELAQQEAEAAAERKKREKWDDSRFSLGKQMDKDRSERGRIEGYKAAEKEAEAAELERWQKEAIGDRLGGWEGMNKPIISAAARHGGVDDLSKAAGIAAERTTDLRDKKWDKWTEKDRQAAGEPGAAKKEPKPKKKKAAAAAAATDKKKSELAGDVIEDECGIVDVTDEAVPPLAEDGDEIFTLADAEEEDEDEDEDEVAATGAPSKAPPAKKAPPSAAKAAATAAAATSSSSSSSTALAKPKADAPAKVLPPPRGGSKVKVGFTKQLLPAPARTKTENAAFDLPLDPLTAPEMFKNKVEGDISQRDPAWLKDRGDRYFRLGDVRSAEEAYGMVLTQFKDSIMGQAIDCVTACYSNRAACRIKAKQYLAAATDCGHALSINSKARCVTEYPKSEQAQTRCRMRLLARRGAAYAHAGVLHRALTDLRRAYELAGGPMPSDAADKQMLSSDVQRVADRHDEVVSLMEKADALMMEGQKGMPPRSARKKAEEEGEEDTEEVAKAKEKLGEAKGLYTDALKRAALEVGALSSRAVCHLHLGDAAAAISDCTHALAELDAEEYRTDETKKEFSGMFAPEPLSKELTSHTDQLNERAPRLRFELLKRRALSRMELEPEHNYPMASIDLKEALKLQPAEPSVVMALDDLSRRAAELGVELEPLPPALPVAGGLALEDGGEEEAEGEEEEEDNKGEEQQQQQHAAGEAGGEPGAASAEGGGQKKSSKPPVGTRSAAQLKADADAAFKEARVGKAVTLYGKALKADAAAEWLGEGGGILFRCQCLANRSACHLKLGQFGETVNDAGAAIAALGTGLVKGEQSADADALLLKLLARRGMALCQLTKYADAAADYARAVELDPANEKLKADLALIEQQVGGKLM